MSASTYARAIARPRQSKSALVMMIGRAKRSRSEIRASTCWNVVSVRSGGRTVSACFARDRPEPRTRAAAHDDRNDLSRMTRALTSTLQAVSAQYVKGARVPERSNAQSRQTSISAGLPSGSSAPDVHHQAAAVLEQPRHRRPARRPIRIMRHRRRMTASAGASLAGVTQGDAVFPQRRSGSAGIVDLRRPRGLSRG